MRHSGWERLTKQRCLQHRYLHVSWLPCALILSSGVKDMIHLILILAFKTGQVNHTQTVHMYLSPDYKGSLRALAHSEITTVLRNLQCKVG